MAYSDFSNESFKSSFGLEFQRVESFEAGAQPIVPSGLLLATLKRNVNLAVAMSTEKARSEMIVSPVLVEVREHFTDQVSLFSGMNFNVAPELGLAGVCDFLFDLSGDQFVISAPVAAIIEAKREDLTAALGQCAAAMLAARMFNERHGLALQAIFGAVTSGTAWRFLRLDGARVQVGAKEHSIDDVALVLGVFIHLLQEARAAMPEAAVLIR